MIKLEKRISDLFPADPLLSLFSQRFANQGFDPIAVRHIISPATQLKPKVLPNAQDSSLANQTPSARIQLTNSPKRPLDDSDTDGGRPRKLARGESPLKGAAGRRLNQQKQNQQSQEITPFNNQPAPHVPPPNSLPRDVLFLLSIIPKAETYHATKFKAEEMVRLIRETNIPNSASQLRPPQTPIGLQQMPGMSQMPPMQHISQTQPRPPIPQVSSMPHMQQIQQQLAQAQQAQQAQQMHQATQVQPMAMHQYPPAPQGQYNGGYPISLPLSSGFPFTSQPILHSHYPHSEPYASHASPAPVLHTGQPPHGAHLPRQEVPSPWRIGHNWTHPAPAHPSSLPP